MKNIHILLTDKPILDGSIDYILKCIKEFKIYNKQYKIGDILDELSWDFDSNYWEPQNIYITNDEKPKAGEWSLYQNKIHKCIEDIVGDEFKKIILTTDQDLIKDGIQSIPDEFLEWFIKNQSCEEVEVEKEKVDLSDLGHYKIYYKYKIIIPKEEVCSLCEKNVLIDGICKECTELICKPFSVVEKQEPKEDFYKIGDFHKDCDDRCKYYCTKGNAQLAECLKEPKQETLEEAAENYGWRIKRNSFSDKVKANELAESAQQDFITGAKWQQKRSYSEENLLGNGENSLDNFLLNSPLHSQEERELIMETIFKWFEQFKKK